VVNGTIAEGNTREILRELFQGIKKVFQRGKKNWKDFGGVGKRIVPGRNPFWKQIGRVGRRKEFSVTLSAGKGGRCVLRIGWQKNQKKGKVCAGGALGKLKRREF